MAEPVTLAEAKAQLGIVSSDTTFDTLVTGLIPAARAHVEDFTGLILVEREVTDTFSTFTSPLRLSAWPVAADADLEFEYSDTAGETVAIEGARLVVGARPATLMPAFSSVWPYAYASPGSVRVTYTAGYEAAGDVPVALKQAILLLIGHWFENRSAVNVGNIVAELPFAVDALCRPYRMVSIA